MGVQKLNSREKLMVAALVECHTENLARADANAAEPYVHATYTVHEARIKRLVAVLADGDDDLYDLFYEALFDITLDGLVHMFETFTSIVRDLDAQRAVA